MAAEAQQKRFVAIDLGAESGRVIVGTLDSLDVVHRFANGPVRIRDSLYWDIPRIFAEILRGLKAAFAKYPTGLASVGLDTWGVDYALLDRDGDPIGLPYHYRDARTDPIPDKVFAKVPRIEVLRQTGVQFMQINTLYQLVAHFAAKPDLTRAAERFLTIPDLLNYWLTGNPTNEYSITTTTQMYDPRKRDWAWSLLDSLGIPRKLFGPVLMPGARIGGLSPHVAAETGAPSGLPVIAPACHDTACAVAAVPAESSSGAGYAYLSSGTWSLLGVESREPIITEESIRRNFTNEGASDGGIRFLKNIMGLWILQECKRSWDERGTELGYAEIARLAEEAGPSSFSIDPDDSRFLKPGIVGDSMPARIEAYCRESGQSAPATPGEFARGVLESLARSYATTIESIEKCTGKPIGTLHIIGGGSQNDLLNRLTADATRRKVLAGPVEATALGNILAQAIVAGDVPSITAGRARIRQAFGIRTFLPS
jgi:rhamnulokinase